MAQSCSSVSSKMWNAECGKLANGEERNIAAESEVVRVKVMVVN